MNRPFRGSWRRQREAIAVVAMVIFRSAGVHAAEREAAPSPAGVVREAPAGTWEKAVPRAAPFDWFTEPEWAFGLSIIAGSATVSSQAAEQARVGTSLPGGFLSLRGAFVRFFFLELGLGYAGADDKAPFTEEACNKFTGECATRSSEIHGFSLYAETGLLGRLFVPIGSRAITMTGLAGVGHHGLHLSQHSGFENCDGCRDGNTIPLNGGFYLSPQVELGYTFISEPSAALLFGLRGKYDHHLNGDVTHATWFGAVMEMVSR